MQRHPTPGCKAAVTKVHAELVTVIKMLVLLMGNIPYVTEQGDMPCSSLMYT
jgi:hypothetical protein